MITIKRNNYFHCAIVMLQIRFYYFNNYQKSCFQRYFDTFFLRPHTTKSNKGIETIIEKIFSGLKDRLLVIRLNIEFAFRRSDTKDPTSDNKHSIERRAGFSYVLAGTLGVGGAYTAKAVVNQFVSSWSASQVTRI